MVTALYFPGAVCFTPRAGLGTAVTALGTHPRFCTWIHTLWQHPRTAHVPLKHTISAEIRDLLFQTFYRSHFVFPNLPHVHVSLQIICLQSRNRVKNFGGSEKGMVWGENPMESLGMSKVGEPNIARSEKLWWVRTKLKIHRC